MTTVPPALAIPEILNMVFTFSQRSALPSAALACRHWHVVSLPQIWIDLNSLLPLMELFCPMVYGDDGWVSLFGDCYYLDLLSEVLCGLSGFRPGVIHCRLAKVLVPGLSRTKPRP